jgi:hypothetical protein
VSSARSTRSQLVCEIRVTLANLAVPQHRELVASGAARMDDPAHGPL